MRKDVPFAVDETYHIFNRGAHKQNIFTCARDYERFLILLHLANDTKRLVLRDIYKKHRGQTSVIFTEEKPLRDLVRIRGYCLMPNHFHLILQEKAEQGITRFMKKVLTGYSMYFNTVYEHSGIVSQGSFKSRHVGEESYFRYIFSYVHLNPLELAFPDYKKDGTLDVDAARAFLRSYPYSSYYDYSVGKRPEGAVISQDGVPEFVGSQNDLEELLRWYRTGEHTEV